MADKLLPKGAELRDPATDPITNAKVIGTTPDGQTAGSFAPELVGFRCQIQHGSSSGKDIATDPGLFGMGVVMTQNGPLHIIQLTHADGSNLAAMLTPSQLVDMLTIQADQAVMMSGIYTHTDGDKN